MCVQSCVAQRVQQQPQDKYAQLRSRYVYTHAMTIDNMLKQLSCRPLRVTSGRVILALLFVASAAGQSVLLTTPVLQVPAGGTVTVPLNMTATGVQPAGLQWTVGYSSSSVARISFTAGPAAVAAGKAITCTAKAGSTMCLLTGTNMNTVASGVVAHVAIQVTSTASGVVPLSLIDGKSATLAGNAIATSTAAATVLAIPLLSGNSTLSGLVCLPGTISTPGTLTCTVSLASGAPLGGAAIYISSSTAQLSVPGSVTVPAGATAASFSAMASAVSSTMPAQITASFNGLSEGAVLTLNAAKSASAPSKADTGTDVTLPTSDSSEPVAVPEPGTAAAQPLVTVTELACDSATLVAGTAATCGVTLSAAAPPEGTVLSLTSSSSLVTVPSTVSVAAGSRTSTFPADVVQTANPAAVTLSASGAGEASVDVHVVPLQLKALTCSPNPVASGAMAVCKVRVTGTVTAPTVVTLNSASTVIRVPSAVTIPAGTHSALFGLYSQSVDTSTAVSVQGLLGTSSATASLLVAGTQSAGALHSSGATPQITAVVNAATERAPACSPGGVAAITGHSLVSGPTDRVAVEIDGQQAPVIADSAERILFECPATAGAAKAQIVVRNSAGVSDPAEAAMVAVAPGIFTTGTGWLGAVLIDDPEHIILARPEPDGRPAQPGETVTIFCTGLGRAFGSIDKVLAETPSVTIDDLSAEVLSATELGQGVYRVEVRVPANVTAGDRIPLTVEIGTARSNTVSIAVDRADKPN
jgi:uncharacterized protein (TIGR03437 family)